MLKWFSPNIPMNTQKPFKRMVVSSQKSDPLPKWFSPHLTRLLLRLFTARDALSDVGDLLLAQQPKPEATKKSSYETCLPKDTSTYGFKEKNDGTSLTIVSMVKDLILVGLSQKEWTKQFCIHMAKALTIICMIVPQPALYEQVATLPHVGLLKKYKERKSTVKGLMCCCTVAPASPECPAGTVQPGHAKYPDTQRTFN